MENLGLSVVEPEQKDANSSNNKKKIERHNNRQLTQIGNRPEQGNEILKKAREVLLGGALHERQLKGKSGSSTDLAGVQNVFITYCINLPDREIESLVRQFNEGFKNKGDYLDPKGIFSVINFLRSRKKLLDANPTQKYAFYFEDVLDAHHQIDIVECIYDTIGGKVVIKKMDLIQVKSSIPPTELQRDKTKEEITKAHKEWLESYVMDKNSLEKEYSHDIPSSLVLEVKNFVEDIEAIKIALQDFCSNPLKFKEERFLSKPYFAEDPDNKNKKSAIYRHRAWLFYKFSSILRKNIDKALKEDKLLEGKKEECLSILIRLDSLEDEVMKRSKMPKKFSEIPEVDSVIVFGETVIETNIYKNTHNMNNPKITGYDYE